MITRKQIEKTEKAIKAKDLAKLAEVAGQNIVVLGDDGKPDWETIEELWEMKLEGEEMPDRAMPAHAALEMIQARSRNRPRCPVSGKALLRSGRSSEFAALDFGGIAPAALEHIAEGCRNAERAGKTLAQVADLVLAYLDRGSAEFQAFMDGPREATRGTVPRDAAHRPATRGGGVNAVALETWHERLAAMLSAEATTCDAARLFSIRADIRECRAKIQELGG